MKKNILGTIAFIAIATVAGWNYQQNQQSAKFSDLALANVDALASGEDDVTCKYDPGDRCMVGATPVPDYDEKDSWF